MRFRKLTVCRLAIIMLAVLLSAAHLSVWRTDAVSTDNNRFNVVVVLDSSGSMEDSDPKGYRYDAISQFTNLLAEHGNHLGGIVFSTNINAQQDPIAIESQKDKDSVTKKLASVAPLGWTNTGEGLGQAVKMLKKSGNPDLPSVILYLSDGNTIMGSDKETKASLEKKADAIEDARENNIPIYSICLNADGNADVSEMEQISKATGGVCREVKSAKDLGEVFNAFYNLIYGTSTIELVDEKFPDSGIIEKEFDIPGIGVEEINIIIYGKTSNLALFKPDGNESDAKATKLSSLTMIKITDTEPGTWRIVVTGVSGDQIKINMVYNTDLGIDVEYTNDNGAADTATPVTISAKLSSDTKSASGDDEYEGYTAKLHILDGFNEETSTAPMTLNGDHFEVQKTFDEGVYNFKVTVSGNYIEKESEIVGPLKVTEAAVVEVNEPPVPIDDPVKKTVYIWPFKPASLAVDMSTLATDKEDSRLTYRIMSSSFMEGTDYTLNGDVITIDHFSLSKGSFEIRAIDSGGEYCTVNLVVIARNVGIMALIGLGIIAVIALIGLGIFVKWLSSRPFNGTCSAQSYNGMTYKGGEKKKARGQIKLSVFGMDPTGLDYRKSYFQATGQNYVWLITDKPVTCNGQKGTKFKCVDGVDMIVTVNEGANAQINVKFTSVMRGGGGRRRTAGRQSPNRSGARRTAPGRAPKRPSKR